MDKLLSSAHLQLYTDTVDRYRGQQGGKITDNFLTPVYIHSSIQKPQTAGKKSLTIFSPLSTYVKPQTQSD